MNRILVIDDEVGFRVAARASLREIHAEVLEAADAASGLELARSEQPDLILCDLNLGSGSGLDVLNGLRQAAETAAIPLILITASDDTTVMRRSMDLGADDFLHKPFTGEELLAAVQARLEKQKTLKAQAERTVRDIESRHRLLLETSTDAVMVLAPPTWKFTEANAATLQIFGARTKAEFLAAGPWDVSPERQADGLPSAAQAKAMIEVALRNGSHFFEWTHRRLNGEVFPATVLLTRLDLAGQTLVQAIVRDITERKRAEAALQESERRYQALAETSPAGVFRTDASGQTTYVNTRWCELAGLSANEALGEGWLRAIHPEDHEAVVRSWIQARANESPSPADYRFLRADGTTAWVMGLAIPERDAAGRLMGYVGTVTDISERKQMEEELRQSEAKYRRLYQTMQDAFVSVDTTGRIQECNAAYQQMLGYTEAELRRMTFLELTPERWHTFEARIIEEQILPRGYSEVYEKEYRRKDGTLVPVELRTVLLRDAAGEPAGMWGTVRDVSARKRTDAALLESEARFRAIATTASDAIIMMDADRKVNFWNSAAERIFGYPQAEALGVAACDLIAPPESQPAFEALFRELPNARNEATRGRVVDLQAVRKDGRPFAAQLSVSAMELNGLWHAVAIVRDVTPQKETMQILMQERILLRTIVDAVPACIYAKDPKARKTLANLADVHSLGAACEQDVLGKTDYELLDRKTAASCYADDMRVIQHDEPVVRQELIANSKGERHWLETTKLPLRDEMGRVVGLVGIGHDITERKRAETMQEALHALASRLSEVNTPVEVARSVFAVADRLWRWDAGSFEVCPPGGNLVETVLCLDIMDGERREVSPTIRFREPTARWRRIKERGAELILRDQSFAANPGAQLVAFGNTACLSASLMFVPIRRQGQTVGILNVQSYTLNAFAEHDLQTLQTLADQCGGALDRILVQEALQRVEQNYREVFNATNEAIFLHDAATGRIVDVNDAMLRLYGYDSKEAVLAGNIGDLSSNEPPYTQQDALRRVRQASEEGPQIYEWLARRKRGERFWVEVSLRSSQIGGLGRILAVVRDITERKLAEQKLHDAHVIQNLILENSTLGVAFMRECRFVWANARLADMLGLALAQVQGASIRVMLPSDEQYEGLCRLAYAELAAGGRFDNTTQMRRNDGSLFWCRFIGKALNPATPRLGSIWMFEDITERKQAEEARQHMEVQLHHSQKLEAIGQLAAGIAHEINTPMQYVGDNTRFLQDAFGELRRVVGAFDKLTNRLHDQPGMADALAPVEAVLQAADVEYLVDEIPKAIEQSLQGVERVTKIVRAMKEFSHPGSDQKTAVNLNHAIESTITVARNEWKYVADLETDFDPQLPLVPCLPGEFNQVILNLIINAAHAITDVVGKNSGTKGRITLRTRADGNWAEIRVEDTGTGIPEAARGRIFEPFFTTKPVGKGTGQGLAIARSVIVDKHGGTLTFETEMGRGTAFIIRLPLTAAESTPTLARS